MPNFLQRVLNILDPINAAPRTQPKSEGGLIGSSSGSSSFIDERISRAAEAGSRSGLLELVEEMSTDGVVADKALTRLCSDAASKEVQIDAPKRRKEIIADLLNRIEYQKYREDLLYLFMRDGDLFSQLEFTRSIQAKRQGYISRIAKMPVMTMVRNSDKLDNFRDSDRAFMQVESIKDQIMPMNPVYFPQGKIIHSRRNHLRGKFFPYGWSTWASGVKIFNQLLIMLDDAVLGRHFNSRPVRHHKVGVGATGNIEPSLVTNYQSNMNKHLNADTIDYATAGTTDIEQVGGTSNMAAQVEDISMQLGILSIGVDYPLDLLSGMIQKGSGGEELFRKESVVRRTVANIIKQENEELLRPLIDRELLLAGEFGKYRITTFPEYFEDESKRSKRGLSELAAITKSPTSFHGENNDEISWEEEKRRIEADAEWYEELAEKYPQGTGIMLGSLGRKDPSAGTQGTQKDPSEQQVRKTQGDFGTENRERDGG